MNFDLMVARPQINLGEYLGFGELIKNNIDARKRVFVLDSNSIKRSIIYAHAKRLILLLHQDSRTTPRRRTRLNQTFLQQLIQLNLQLSQLIGWHSIGPSRDRSHTQNEFYLEFHFTVWR
jgi:hypothetical protein